MPIRDDKVTVLHFGSGDIHMASAVPTSGPPYGKIRFGTGPAGEVGRESHATTSDVPVQVVMRFDSVESLDAVLGQMNALRAAMIEREAAGAWEAAGGRAR